MEKLGQLYQQRRPDGTRSWDLIVVDTPPSRSALDFLDAPNRLGSFLDGRFIRMMTAPARAGGRAYLKVVTAGVSLAASAVSKVLGSDLLTDVQNLIAALDTVFGGFRDRADKTYALLQRRGTAFLVVASPERDALREAGYFIDRLSGDGMPLAGLIVNRMSSIDAHSIPGSTALSVAETLEETGRRDAVKGLLRLHADVAEVAERQLALTRRFLEAHPGVAVAAVPAAAQDIHDLEALRKVGQDVAEPGPSLAAAG